MTNQTETEGYQIFVVNIKYGKQLSKNSKSSERPDVAVLDVPDGLLKLIKDKELFESSIESFAYNTITKKYGAEVTHCQVYLP